MGMDTKHCSVEFPFKEQSWPNSTNQYQKAPFTFLQPSSQLLTCAAFFSSSKAAMSTARPFSSAMREVRSRGKPYVSYSSHAVSPGRTDIQREKSCLVCRRGVCLKQQSQSALLCARAKNLTVPLYSETDGNRHTAKTRTTKTC